MNQIDDQETNVLRAADPLALIRFLGWLARDPVGAMRSGPRMTWTAGVLLQGTAGAVAGAVYGLPSKSVLNLLASLIAFATIAIAASFAIAIFLRTSLAIFGRKGEDARLGRRELYSLVSQATLPYLALHAFAPFVPPIDLVGFSLACALLAVGLVERFRQPRAVVIRLLAAAFLIFFAAWSWVQARSYHGRNGHWDPSERQSLDELERGLTGSEQK